MGTESLDPAPFPLVSTSIAEAPLDQPPAKEGDDRVHEPKKPKK